MDSREPTKRVTLHLRESTIAQLGSLQAYAPQLTRGDIVDLLFYGFGGEFRLRIFDAIQAGAFSKPERRNRDR